MLLNMVCRLQQLDIRNFIVAAFDPDAYTFCRKHVLPCYPVSAAVANVNDSSAHEYGSKAFRTLTKLKSQEVLRILKLGYNVLWSDVDIFWKVNTIPLLLGEMGDDINIAIQSNAPPTEDAENGMRRINSGFYLVKRSDATIEAFTQIVEHAHNSSLSEQPSFYAILCGENSEYTVGMSKCFNPKISTTTLFLNRGLYPNGAMENVLKDVTSTTQDDVAIAHFNWRVGLDTKMQSFVNSSMWLLSEDDQCLYHISGQARSLSGRRGLIGGESSMIEDGGRTVLSK